MCGHSWKVRNGCPVVYRLTWLKSRLRILGLHHRGPMVHYSPVSPVQEAIEVCPATINNYTLATRTIPRYTTIQAELQGCSTQHRLSTDVGCTETKAWSSCEKVWKVLCYYLKEHLKSSSLFCMQIHSPVGAQSKCCCHWHSHQDEFRGQKSYCYGSSTTNTVKCVGVLHLCFCMYNRTFPLQFCRGLKVGGLS